MIPITHPLYIISTPSFKQKTATYLHTMLPSILKTNTLISHFSICKSMNQLKQIHLQTIVNGVILDPFISFKIIAFCCTQNRAGLDYARQVFDKIPEPKVVLWNTMIKGYSSTSSTGHAVGLYVEMLRKDVRPDRYTFPFLLKGFTRSAAGSEIVNGIHCHVWKFGFGSGSNPAVDVSLVRMYSLRGNLDDARRVFDASLKRDAIVWNVMIAGYNGSRRFEEAKTVFDEMEARLVVPTSVTLISMLSACSKLKDGDGCKRVHGYVKDGWVESNLVLENALIDAYAACGDTDAALAVFGEMKTRDVISWTAVLSGFLNAGKLEIARGFFDRMPERDSVSWTAMINGYVKRKQFEDGLMLYEKMRDAKIEPDEFTIVSVLTACANTNSLELAESVKAGIDKNKIKNDVFVGNALIDMYFKCGEVRKAVEVFEKMPVTVRDKFTWTNVIVGYAINGFGSEAIDAFDQMTNVSIKPDEVCYLGVLSACTHAGLVNEGRKFFTNMTVNHGLKPGVEHYGCMVDLLGRAGRLAEAYDVINGMPIAPNSVVWRALLGGCGIHKEVDLGEKAAKKLIALEPENGGGYALLCNIYAASKRWEDLREVRLMMMNRGVSRTRGYSSIDIYGTVHEFVAQDRSHFLWTDIYAMLEMVTEVLRVSGYTPQTNETFLDVVE